MKYYILIFSAIYLWGIAKQLIRIATKKTESTQEYIDRSMRDVITDYTDEKNRDLLVATYTVLEIMPLLYLLFSSMYVNTFIFAVICLAYSLWSIIDLKNMSKYIKEDIVSKTFNSKLYKYIGIPFDLALIFFMTYQLYLKW